MDVVVRTPHGDADVQIVSAPSTTTLGDLLAFVTGQAPPSVARVGDRVIGTSQPLDDIGLHVGAVIDARPSEPPAPGDGPTNDPRSVPTVELVQLTGRGAGTISRLTPGRYRIGAGRRLNADELTRAPVETEAFELDLRGLASGSGDPPVVTAGARTHPTPIDPDGAEPDDVLAPTIDGAPIEGAAPWSSGRLSVAGRVFELHHTGPSTGPDTGPGRTSDVGVGHEPESDRMQPDERGTIPFQRSPVAHGSTNTVAVSARRRAGSPSLGLWARRRDDAGALRLAVGLLPDDRDAVLDLAEHRRCALVGSERFVAALARTLVVEATTVHGPSDLRVVIASTPERIGQWDWAKWLPHVRMGGDPLSHPLLLVDHDELDEWAARQSHAGERSVPTIVVVDHAPLWTRRPSPLFDLVTEPPEHLRVVALCSELPEAPGDTSLIVEERPPESMDFRPTREGAALVGSLARLRVRSGRATTTIDHVRPALVTRSAALDIALRIAPFDDLDIVRPQVTTSTLAAPSISELVDLHADDGDGPGRRSSTGDVSVSVGLIDEQRSAGIGAPPQRRHPARLDLAASRTTLLSSDDREIHDAVVASIILGAASTHRSDRLAILTVGSDRPAWHDEIPHLAGHVDRASPDDPARLVHRVAHVLTSEPSLDVVVVIEDAFSTTRPVDSGRGAAPIELAAGILDLVETLSRVHVLLTTSLAPDQIAESTRRRVGAVIELGGSPEHPRGVVTDGDSRLAIVGPTRLAPPAGGSTPVRPVDDRTLRIAPCVHGRSMSPLERRIDRLAKQAAESVPDITEARTVAHRIAQDTASPATLSGALLPPPLPTSASLAQLLEQFEGDGVPVGLLDRPETATHEAYWWRPGTDGSLLGVGSPRSGVGDLIDLLTVGIATRISAADLRIHAIEPLPQRRRALELLPHTVEAVSSDEADPARRVVAEVAHLLGMRRAAGRSVDDPDVLLLVGDLGRLRRWLDPEHVGATLEQLATIGADGPAHGINLVCLATRGDDLGPLVRLAGDRLVGTVSDPDDRRRLGVPTPGPADRHAGRCWSVDAERRVQLATPPEAIEAHLADLVAPVAESTEQRDTPTSASSPREPGPVDGRDGGS